MEPEKNRPKNTDGIVLVEVLRPQKQESHWSKFHSKSSRRLMSQLKDSQAEGVYTLLLSFYSVHTFNELD